MDSCQLQVGSARASHFVDAETCEFPSLSMTGEYKPWTKHGRNMDDPWINVSIYRLCVSRRIDTRQIVYLLYEDACPIISIHKNEI